MEVTEDEDTVLGAQGNDYTLILSRWKDKGGLAILKAILPYLDGLPPHFLSCEENHPYFPYVTVLEGVPKQFLTDTKLKQLVRKMTLITKIANDDYSQISFKTIPVRKIKNLKLLKNT